MMRQVSNKIPFYWKILKNITERNIYHSPSAYMLCTQKKFHIKTLILRTGSLGLAGAN